MLLTNSATTKHNHQSYVINEQRSEYKRHDQLFKQLVHPFFEQFLKAFYPIIHKQIDFTTISYLSEEMYTATYKSNKRILDLVAEVKLKKTGTLIVIHIEPQSYVQSDFNDRMFKYFGLLYNKLEKPILPIAIFSYDQGWEKSEFVSNVLMTEVIRFNYLTLHLRKINWRDFSHKKNPVSAALLSKMNYSEDERIHVKLAFLNILANLKLTKELNHLVIGFFESYLQLSEEEEELLMKKMSELDNADEILKLPISYEERGKKIGERIGRAEEKRKIALQMLRENVDIESIMKFTQLKQEEVEQLKRQL